MDIRVESQDDDRAMKDVSEELRRWQISIGRGLMLTFGLLVFLAVAIVLFLGVWSARENTISLTRQLGETALSEMENTLHHHLDPARATVDHLAARMEAGTLDPDDIGTFTNTLAGSLSPMPQVTGLVFIRPDGQGLRAIRNSADILVSSFDLDSEPRGRMALEEASQHRNSYWGKPVRPSQFRITLINVRRPVVVNDRFAGVLVASVRISELSNRIAKSSAGFGGGQAFVLYGDTHVLAHPKLRDGFEGASPEQPLPTIDGVNDPVLQSYVAQTGKWQRGTVMAQRMGVEIIQTADDEYWPTVSRRLTAYGETPWTIGLYFRNEDVNAELRRLLIAGVAGLFVLALAILSAWLLSRYLARPLNGLAIAAGLIRDFELDGIRALPGSRLREIDAAASAFNAMVGSLRWFEIYVPRALVQRLISHGDGTMQSSEQRNVTVLFTDIVGFTSLSEDMSAEDTATLLNSHFALLGTCVETEEGTIDKFIGDALMAFWGAPELQPDHAERACRAALAMRAAVDADNRRRTDLGLPPIAVRIGLHTGETIVGNIGAPGRINYTIVGDTVNTANRLESLARQHPADGSTVTILLSGDTWNAASATARDARSLGRHRLAGRQEETELFAL